MSNAVPPTVGLDEPFPGRKIDYTGTGMSLSLLQALASKPALAQIVVNTVILGRSYRWSTRSIEIPCAEVEGGYLRFEGKLIGSGELAASIEILDRLSDVATFSVDADNSDYIGMNLGEQTKYATGQVVPSLHGAKVEVSMVHPDSEWSQRYVVLYGYLGNASYGIDGNTLTFDATSEWAKIDQKVGFQISPMTFNDADKLGTNGSEIGVNIGTGRVTIQQIGSDAKGVWQPFFELTDPYDSCYLVSANWVGNRPISHLVQAVWDSDGTKYSHQNTCRQVRLLDGSQAEVLCVSGTDEDTLYAYLQSANNEWFGYAFAGDTSASPPSNQYISTPRYNPVSIGSGIAYWLNRVGSGSPLDIDYSGALQLQRLGCAAYGVANESITSARDVLENRIVLETYGFVSNRFGKYGFTPFPFPSTFGGCPLVAATLVFGDELLDRTVLTEVGGDSIINNVEVDYGYDPYYGEYRNGGLKISNEINASVSYWPMLSQALVGPGAFIQREMPDLKTWYDVRSALRVEERIGGFVLREIEYTGLPALARLNAGDVVRVVDEAIGFKVVVDEDDPYIGKAFIVLEVVVTMETVVKLRLREWPVFEDFAPTSVIGNGFSGFTPQGQPGLD